MKVSGWDGMKNKTIGNTGYIYTYMKKWKLHIYIHEEVKAAWSCLTLCDSMDCSLPSSYVHGILQARTLNWVAISFSGGSPQSRDRTWVSCIAGRFFTNWTTREAQLSSYPHVFPKTPCIHSHVLFFFFFWTWCLCAKSFQSCLTLCETMDHSPPGCSVHGMLQAGILEWLAMAGDLSIPGIEPLSLVSLALANEFFTTHATCLNLLQYCFCFMFQGFGGRHLGPYLPDQGSNLYSRHWKVKS